MDVDVLDIERIVFEVKARGHLRHLAMELIKLTLCHC